MKTGHICAFVGAVLTCVGVTLLDWQTFEIAAVTVRGFEVPLAGQALLLLALLIAGLSAAGLRGHRQQQLAAATLCASVFAFGWLVYGQAGRLDVAIAMPYEQVTMGAGFVLACWGAVLMFIGPLVVFACEPSWSPDTTLLRVAVLWRDTILEERLLTPGEAFTVAEGVTFAAGLNGRHTLATDGVADPLQSDAWGMMDLPNDRRVFYQIVVPERRTRRGRVVVFEEGVTASVGVSLFTQVAFVVVAILLWDESASRTRYVEPLRPTDIRAELLLPMVVEIAVDEGPDDGASKRADGDEGRFGDAEVDPRVESKTPQHDAPLVDRVDMRNVGLNDLLSTDKLGGSGAISQILAMTSEGMSNKLAVAMAGSDGEFVIGAGSNGMGFTGDGDGGGDRGVGRIRGLGTIDTSSNGLNVRLGPKKKRRVGTMEFCATGAACGRTTVFCSKSAIAAAVRRRAGAIRACYEQRLQVVDGLKGKITAQWTIDLEGRAKGVSASVDTLKDTSVTGCVLRALRRARFEKPSGGVCVVRWPFVFAPG